MDTESHRLPLEILYHILDIIVQGEEPDVQSTRSLSLVCRAFLPQCQKTLFRTLNIFADAKRPRGDKFPNRQTRKLYEIFQYKPQLASHFTTLQWGVGEESMSTTSGFLIVLERIQERTKIRTLHLYSRCVDSRSFATFRDGRLLYQLVTPFITRLEINNMCLINPSTFFVTCKKLEELQVEGVEVGYVHNPVPEQVPRAGPPPSIKSYEVTTTYPLFKVAKIVDLSRLRILKIWLNYTNGLVEYLRSLFNSCANALQEFHLMRMNSYIGSFLDLGFFPALEIITLPIDQLGHGLPIRRRQDESFRMIDKTLATIPKENKIKNLNFYIRLSGTPEVSLPWDILTPCAMRISAGKPLRLHFHVMYVLPETGGIVSGNMVPYEEYRSWCKLAFDSLASAFESLTLGKFPSYHLPPNV